MVIMDAVKIFWEVFKLCICLALYMVIVAGCMLSVATMSAHAAKLVHRVCGELVRKIRKG